MRKFTLAAMMIVGLIASARQASADFIIDTFDADQSLKIGGAAGSSTVSGTVNSAGIFGGSRDTDLTKQSGTGGVVAVDTNIFEPSFLHYDQSTTTGPGNADGAFSLTYDGLGTNFAALGSAFELSLLSLSSDVNLTIEVTGAGNVVGTLTDLINPANAQTLDYLFTSFTNPGVFTNVQSIKFTFDQVAATGEASLTLDEIGVVGVGGNAVPEPSSIALLGLGIIGLAGRQLRRRKQVA